ncbi:MAG: DnaD domain protein [Erysipelotrichaceae bacterium]|jgi:DNA replication protein|nr:DnaD domain protein [Erysipelotrichaceae bacterium]MDD3924565.1 DnaD domain protein [Erysipelotrichaceae bacterium]MDD4642161.1 DnaD domain protein [Erysipelotrichaceae bacterium]
MEKYWNKSWFDKKIWLLENMSFLNLDLNEVALLMMIDHHNEHNMELSLNILCDKTNQKVDVIDDMINSLRTKGYLDIKVVNKHVIFTLDGLFEDNNAPQIDSSSIYELFESELGKVLSESDIRRINDWLHTYDQQMIIEALREAIIYQKKNLNYIHNVLKNKKSIENE